jgi:hypothetical protein
MICTAAGVKCGPGGSCRAIFYAGSDVITPTTVSLAEWTLLNIILLVLDAQVTELSFPANDTVVPENLGLTKAKGHDNIG